jgi:hypothetical protein
VRELSRLDGYHLEVNSMRSKGGHNPDRFIASCTSWDDFYERTKLLATLGAKGAVFERLTQLYLQTTPEYCTETQHVWLLREVPADIRKRRNPPGPDEGIDLIARTRRGQYWAIQTKFRSQRDTPLNRRLFNELKIP